MKTVTFSQLRNEARKYFDAVENGETIEVYRHGKPIAILMPTGKHSLERWKKSSPLQISGTSLSRIIFEERAQG